MRICKWLTLLFVACLVPYPAHSVGAQEPMPPSGGPPIVVYTPHPVQLELALDEVELDWSAQPRAKQRAPAQHAVPTARGRVVMRQALRAIVSLSGVTNSADLLREAEALKSANPGAEAHLVLYEPKRPRGPATRRLLTREVGLLLEKGADPQATLAGLSVAGWHPVPGVPDGYVVEASDPMAALDLANALRQRPGVRSAYPLLKRQFFAR